MAILILADEKCTKNIKKENTHYYHGETAKYLCKNNEIPVRPAKKQISLGCRSFYQNICCPHEESFEISSLQGGFYADLKD